MFVQISVDERKTLPIDSASDGVSDVNLICSIVWQADRAGNWILDGTEQCDSIDFDPSYDAKFSSKSCNVNIILTSTYSDEATAKMQKVTAEKSMQRLFTEASWGTDQEWETYNYQISALTLTEIDDDKSGACSFGIMIAAALITSLAY